MKQEVIDSEELTRIIEENSPSPMIVPGTDSEPRRPVKLTEPETESGSSSLGG